MITLVLFDCCYLLQENITFFPLQIVNKLYMSRLFLFAFESGYVLNLLGFVFILSCKSVVQVIFTEV